MPIQSDNMDVIDDTPPQHTPELEQPHAHAESEGEESPRNQMALRSGTRSLERAPAYRRRRTQHERRNRTRTPSNNRNTNPSWKQLTLALGEPAGYTITPLTGWDLESTRQATELGVYAVMGMGQVLHHPECSQLRTDDGIYISSVQMAPPFYAQSRDLGYRFPFTYGCCYGLWRAARQRAAQEQSAEDKDNADKNNT